MRFGRFGGVVVVALVTFAMVSACSSPSTPTVSAAVPVQTVSPTPTPTPAPTVTPVPSTFSLTGTLTDGTSHGILPNLTVQVASGTNVGKSAITDSSGNYAMSGLSAGTSTLSVSATSYETTTQPVTLSANTRVDLVLQRLTMSSLTVACNGSTISNRESTSRCAATVHYSDGSTAVLAGGVSWQSSNTALATVDAGGLVTSISGSGTTFNTGTYYGLSASFLVTLKGCGLVVPTCF